MGYRSRDEIISQILEMANKGDATKTKIFYEVSPNYTKIKEYLTILIESNLLRYDHESYTFKITEKGRDFLQAYSQMDEMLKGQEQQQRV
ncbi:MAG TPA: winged helix-turn-helix domain-containing protein [Nitrososphaera sp.]|jgi:predicted transcriptional regulator|nr:winged helix-turn-helix domain-containing protein [Nitrososphaera sp.]